MVQAQLSRAGFDVVIRQLELSAFLARVYGPTHDFDAAVLGIPGDAGLGYLAPLADLAGLRAARRHGRVAAILPRLGAGRIFVSCAGAARDESKSTWRHDGHARGVPTVHDWWVTR